MAILLSIKPKYADAIYRGDKKYECRKIFPKQQPSYLVFMYETCPVRRITGYFYLSGRYLWEVDLAWRKLAPELCIDERAFFDYYKGCQYAHIWDVKMARKFIVPIPLPDIGLTDAPQSYIYLNSRQNWYLQQFM